MPNALENLIKLASAQVTDLIALPFTPTLRRVLVDAGDGAAGCL